MTAGARDGPSAAPSAAGPCGDPAAQILRAGTALVDLDLIVGSLGNISARVADGFMVTPSRIPYGEMGFEDLVVVSPDGVVLAGTRPPSSEWRMHAAIYRERPHAAAIVHTHSVHATAWSFLDAPLEPELEDCTYYGLDTIRTSEPARSASAELARSAVDASRGSRRAVGATRRRGHRSDAGRGGDEGRRGRTAGPRRLAAAAGVAGCGQDAHAHVHGSTAGEASGWYAEWQRPACRRATASSGASHGAPFATGRSTWRSCAAMSAGASRSSRGSIASA